MARIHASQINPTGSFKITGSLEVQGQTVLTQTNTVDPALIISGAMDVVQAQIASELQRARITIQNLGAIGDREDNNEIDLGGFF
jgi:ketopantoate hydroxymethyltransferase